MSRRCLVELHDIFDLVMASEDYGFGTRMFKATMADWAGVVTREEIEQFLETFRTPEAIEEGYAEENVAFAREQVERWWQTYVVDA